MNQCQREQKRKRERESEKQAKENETKRILGQQTALRIEKTVFLFLVGEIIKCIKLLV